MVTVKIFPRPVVLVTGIYILTEYALLRSPQHCYITVPEIKHKSLYIVCLISVICQCMGIHMCIYIVMYMTSTMNGCIITCSTVKHEIFVA